MIQAAKFIRVFFTFFFLAILLLIYGYLPLTLDIGIDSYGRIGREFFFYSCLGLFVLLNLITYFFRYFADKSKMGYYQRVLIHLLPSILYFALSLIIGFLGVINNAQSIDPNTYNYLNYLSAGIIILWFFSFLFVLIRRI